MKMEKKFFKQVENTVGKGEIVLGKELNVFENTMRKGEIPGNQQFLLSSQCFLLFHKQITQPYQHLNNHLQMLQFQTV